MRFYLFVISLLIYSGAFPQIGKKLSYSFHHIDKRSSIFNDFANLITQDRNGYMWIVSGYNGVQRFDGSRFRSYQDELLSANPQTPFTVIGISNYNDTIVINCGNQVFYFDENTEKFKPYYIKETPTFEVKFTDNQNKEIYIGKNYFYENNTLTGKRGHTAYFFHKLISEDAAIIYDKYNSQYYILKDDQILVLDVDSKRAFNTESNNKNAFLSYLKRHSLNKGFNHMMIDGSGNLWTSNWQRKIFKYNLITKKVTSYDITDIQKRQFIQDVISKTPTATGFFEDNYGQVWVSTYNGGLLKYAKDRDEFDFCIAERNVKNAIRYNYQIQGLYQDREDNIWVGTDNGINVFNPYNHSFKILRHEEARSVSLPKSEIVALCQTSNHEILVGTWGSGVTVYDSNFVLLKHFSFPKYEENLVWCFDEDSRGNVWIGCQAGFVTMYNPQKGAFESKFHLKSNSTIRCLTKDSLGNIYFGLHNGNIVMYNKKHDSIIEYNYEKPNKHRQTPISTLFVDTKQNIWALSSQKLYLFDNKKMIFVDSFHVKKDKIINASNRFGSALHQINDSLLFVGDPLGGAYYINIISKKIKIIDNVKQISNQLIKASRNVGDKILFTTPTGLFCYSPNDRHKVIRYHIDENIIDGFFELTEIVNLHNGEFATATNSEVLIFDVNNLNARVNKIPPCKITGLKVFSNQMLIDSFLNVGKPIRLRYNQNTISIHFSNFQFTPFLPNNYIYKLSGVDADWIVSEGDGQANYTNLSPGKYTFRVRSEDSVDDLNYTSFDFIISPPFFYTWWFITVCTTGLGLVLFFMIKSRIRNIRKEGRLKERILETEIAALQAQMNPHFIFNCISAIDNLIQDKENDKAVVYLGKFAHLIRNILYSSRNNLVLFSKDLETLKLFINLEQFRSNNKFVYTLDVDSELLEGNFKVPPLLIQPFIENAIRHGLLNKTEGERKLGVQIELHDDTIIYTITDNGVGRHRAQELREINKPNHVSYGIQMSIERIKIYNSRLKESAIKKEGAIEIFDLIENDKPTGTRVVVKLKAHE
ncbi:MAG: histidine kinase [Ferruginibacter sp.]|nr:histidine kinase [Ferruginibacter sp.]